MTLLHHERITDPEFRRAVDLMDAGDVDGLGEHLNAYPELVHQRVDLGEDNAHYFLQPTLLEFCAGNPVRHAALPPNIVAVAAVVLAHGGRSDAASMNSTLQLVSSGRVPRECGVQLELIGLLCAHGADPDEAMLSALGHGEVAAVEALVQHGATQNLMVVAATGQCEHASQLLSDADAESRHYALALASLYGHDGCVAMLLAAGEDPNRFNPPGVHAHSTPLHQAALAGHLKVVKVLVEGGARLDIADTLHQATARGWAAHAGHSAVEEYLAHRS